MRCSRPASASAIACRRARGTAGHWEAFPLAFPDRLDVNSRRVWVRAVRLQAQVRPQAQAQAQAQVRAARSAEAAAPLALAGARVRAPARPHRQTGFAAPPVRPTARNA